MIKKNKTILISPLNWGLGHAVRDIPLINKLINAGYNLIIAAEGESAKLLEIEFPTLKHINLSSFKIKYSKKKSFTFKIIIQLPKIIIGIRKEHLKLKKIIHSHKIDLIISDNRYGLYCKNIPSIFISHQIFIQLPKKLKLLEKIVDKIHQKRILKFQKCLIPDFCSEINLSGNLSHKYNLPNNYSFIGILSQFVSTQKKDINFIYDIMVIISGPEPQRSIFDAIITKQLTGTSKKILIVSGKPQKHQKNTNKNITRINHLSRDEMQKAITSSKTIISRAGYTTIMDLIKLQKKAILIPTPGQTEQEYLADYHKYKKIFVIQKQDSFNIEKAIKEIQKLQANFTIFKDNKKEDFLEIIKNMFPKKYLDNEKCQTQ